MRQSPAPGLQIEWDLREFGARPRPRGEPPATSPPPAHQAAPARPQRRPATHRSPAEKAA